MAEKFVAQLYKRFPKKKNNTKIKNEVLNKLPIKYNLFNYNNNYSYLYNILILSLVFLIIYYIILYKSKKII